MDYVWTVKGPFLREITSSQAYLPRTGDIYSFKSLIEVITLITIQQSKSCLKVRLLIANVYTPPTIHDPLMDGLYTIGVGESHILPQSAVSWISNPAIYGLWLIKLKLITKNVYPVNCQIKLSVNHFHSLDTIVPNKFSLTQILSSKDPLNMLVIHAPGRNTTWEEAEKICESLGGSLPVIETQDYFTLLQQILLGTWKGSQGLSFFTPLKLVMQSGLFVKIEKVITVKP